LPPPIGESMMTITGTQPLFLLRRVLRVSLGCAALVLFVTACGGSEEKEAPPAAEQKAAPAKAPAAAAKKAPAKPAVKQAAKEAKPQTVEGQLAVKVELPDYYPDDAPVYPGSMPSQHTMTEDGQASLTFGIEDDAESVANYAREFILKNDWAMSLDQEIQGGHLLRASKGARHISVLVTEVNDGSMMSVAVHR